MFREIRLLTKREWDSLFIGGITQNKEQHKDDDADADSDDAVTEKNGKENETARNQISNLKR